MGAGNRAINEGDRDLRGEGGKRLADDVDKSGRLGHEPLELRQEGALGVSLVVDLLSLGALSKDARLDKIHELPLEACPRELEYPRKFAPVPPALRMEEDRGEDSLSDGREESIYPSACTHNAYL